MYSLYGIPYDLHNGCYNAIFIKLLLIQSLYKEVHNIVELTMSWLVVVSKLCIDNIDNIKMTNVCRKDNLCIHQLNNFI